MATHPEPEFEQFRDILDELARAAPTPPDVHWGRYRAELREKLEARRVRRRAPWWRPVPLALSAGLAGLLLFFAFFAIQSGRQNGAGVDLATVEEAAIGGRLRAPQQDQGRARPRPPEEVDRIPPPRPVPGRPARSVRA